MTITVLHDHYEWIVWGSMEPGDPLTMSESFIICTGPTKVAATRAARIILREAMASEALAEE